MTEYQPLTPEEIAQTAQSYYAARELKTASQVAPVFVAVGGQPGAGKSFASQIARDELGARGGFIRVDADRMRERIDTKGALPTSEQSQPDAAALVGALRRLAIAGRRNILEEGTFRNPDDVGRAFVAYKDLGYKVELLAVATPREESVLGIYQRFEAQHAQRAENPRFVPEAYHEEAMDGFAKTVARHENEFSRARVIDRGGRVLFDSQKPGRKDSAIEALTRGQLITDKRLAAVATAWEAVKEHAKARGAEAGYLDAIDRNAQDVVDTQKGRIHIHALAQLAGNFRAVNHDSRFAGHSDAELAKVAYYRGFHEKAFEFKGMTTDFKAFDEAMADRAKAQQLPHVAEIEYLQLEREKPRSLGDDQGLSL